MPWVDAASATLPDETLLAVRQGASLVALARAAGSWYAVDGWCSHAECPLTDGWLEADAVRCACHASLFDLATGAPLEGPAEEPLRVYATRIAHGRVEVELP
jgi:3-phenylpropionate/trans-cinnamate dioxygenase ferredoxin subunit